MPAKLYDNKTGQWVMVPDEQVQSAVAEGQYSFESGIDIPVVAPDGQTGSVPSDKVQQAFQKGFRWQTYQDATAAEAAGIEESNKRAFDQPLVAGTRGFMRGFLPGADAIQQGMAEAYGTITGREGLGEQVAEAQQKIKEYNPTASTIGEIAGMVTSPILGGAASAAGKAAGSVVKGTSAVSKLAKSGLVNAAEGAVYGAAEGVNELALYGADTPDEVAEKILGTAATGAMFGAIIGPAFEGTRQVTPLFKDLAEAVGGGTSEFIKNRARNTTSLAGKLVSKFSDKGDDISRLAKAPQDVRTALVSGAGDDVVKAQKEFAEATARLEKDQKKITRGLLNYAKREAKQYSKQIDETVKQYGNDAFAAQTGLHKEIQTLSKQFDEVLQASNSPATRPDEIYVQIENTIKRLEQTKNKDARKLAARLQETIDERIAGVRGQLTESMTEGTEFLLLRDTKDILSKFDLRGISGGQVAKQLDSYIDDVYAKHPNTELVQVNAWLNDRAAQYRTISKYIGQGSSSRFIGIVQDPAKAAKLQTLFKNSSELGPEFLALKETGDNVRARQQILKQIQRRLNDFDNAQNLHGPGLDVEDLDEVVKILGVEKASVERLSELAKIQEQIRAAAEGSSPVDSLIRMKKALGQPVDDLEKLVGIEPYAQSYANLTGTTDKADAAKMFESLMKMGFKGSVGATIGGWLGGAEGAKIGAALGAGGTYAKAAFHGEGLIKNLSRLERAIDKSNQLAQKAFAKTAKGLTSKTAQRATTIYQTKKRRKSQTLEVMKNIGKINDFNTAEQFISESIPTLEGAPQLQIALGTKLYSTAQFLASKAPQDPFAGATVGESDWEPSNQELKDFETYLNAAENPMSVLDNIAKGKLVMEEVETLQTLYPGLYTKLQDAVISAMVEKGRDVSYTQKITIGTLFNVDTDYTLTPDFIKSMQDLHKMQQSSQPNAANKPGNVQTDPMENVATDAQQLTFKAGY